VKFKDAELLGLPLQLVVGDRGLKEGVVELGARGGARESVPLTEAVARLVGLAESIRGAAH